ncbi:MAG TPA: tetratricopeptide repeat protein [Bacteroidales bacterium]|nr:tetratricopeptide repeat protein [Bacteroidales bacterium]
MHFIPIEGRVLVADRYAYPAYIGLFMILGSTTDFLLQRFKKTYIIAGMSIITLILSIKTYTDLDTWKSSKTLWEKALKVNPKNHYAMYSLSLANFVEDKNPQKALQYLDSAIKLKEDFQYYNNRGRIRYSVKDLNGALEDFNKSIALDSNNFAAYNNRGAIQQHMGNLKKALSDFDKAISLNPNFEDAINNRKKISRLLFIDSILINNVTIASEIHPEVVEFINNMAEAFINNKEFDTAAFYLLKGIYIEPTQQAFHEKLAVMYQLNKEYAKALEAYNKGLSYLPSNPTLLCGRGILFLEKGDTLNACNDFQLSASLGNPDAVNLSQQFCRN